MMWRANIVILILFAASTAAAAKPFITSDAPLLGAERPAFFTARAAKRFRAELKRTPRHARPAFAQELRSRAINADGQGGMKGKKEAVALFYRAVLANPAKDGLVHDMGVSLMRYGTALMGSSNAQALRLFRHALQAFETSLLMQAAGDAVVGGDGKQAAQNIAAVNGYIQRLAPERCAGRGDALSCSFAADGDAGGGQLEGAGGATTGDVCDPSNLRVHARAEGAEGGGGGVDSFGRRLPLSRAQVTKAARALEECGVVVVEGAYGRDITGQLRDAQADHFQWFQDRIAGDKLTSENSTDSARRSSGRWELRNPLRAPFTDGAFVANRAVLSVATAVLKSARVEIDTFSSVTSLGRTPRQHWHNDVGELFKGEPARTRKRMPTQGVVIFYPLVDVPMAMGPTEFLLKSHKPCAERERVEREMPRGSGFHVKQCAHAHDAGTFHATASAGAAVMFDVRIMHRGGRNTRKARRPMMYTAYVHEWYLDAVNFNRKHTRKYDALATTARVRKLLNRPDELAYVEGLEALVKGLGAGDQLEAMQSRYLFDAHSYEDKLLEGTEEEEEGEAEEDDEEQYAAKVDAGGDVEFEFD